MVEVDALTAAAARAPAAQEGAPAPRPSCASTSARRRIALGGRVVVWGIVRLHGS